ncbi:MAG: hypothetical protein DWH91_05315 [Planctomycetota bacterium]|nr:MAG: hypothetical protein DWH91_05315 [Planctomycetota bacterium]
MKSWAWCLAGIVLWTQSAQAEGPLDQISADADIVIRIGSHDATVEHVAALAESVQLGTGDLVTQNATAFGLLLSNPTMAGVDKSQEFYLVLFTQAEAEPKALFAIPATDAPAMQKALPDTFESQVRDGWVFYADKSHGVPAAVTEEDSLSHALTESDAGKLLAESDIGLYINVPHLLTIYGDKIEQGKAQFEQVMEQAQNAPGPNAAGAVEVLKMEVELLQKVLDQTESWTTGVSVSAEGMEVTHLLALDEEEDVAAFLAMQPQSEFTGMSRLKKGLPVYFGFSADMKSIGPLISQMTAALYKDQTFTQSMQGTFEKLSALNITNWCGSFDLTSGDYGLFSGSYFVETTQAAELLEATREMAESMKSIDLNGIHQEITYDKESETVNNHKIDVMTTQTSVDPNHPGAQAQDMILNLMMGEKGFQNRITPLSEGLLQAMGGGPTGMEDSLAAFQANANLLADEREGQAEKAHGLLILDLPGLLSNGLLVATSIPGIPVPFTKEAVEELAIERSYSTTAISSEDGVVRVHCRIPTTQFQGLVKLGMFVRQQQ